MDLQAILLQALSAMSTGFRSKTHIEHPARLRGLLQMLLAAVYRGWTDRSRRQNDEKQMWLIAVDLNRSFNRLRFACRHDLLQQDVL